MLIRCPNLAYNHKWAILVLFYFQFLFPCFLLVKITLCQMWYISFWTCTYHWSGVLQINSNWWLHMLLLSWLGKILFLTYWTSGGQMTGRLFFKRNCWISIEWDAWLYHFILTILSRKTKNEDWKILKRGIQNIKIFLMRMSSAFYDWGYWYLVHIGWWIWDTLNHLFLFEIWPRLGWTWWVCLSEGICRVLLL